MERSGCYEKNGSHEFIDAIDGCWKFQLRLHLYFIMFLHHITRTANKRN